MKTENLKSGILTTRLVCAFCFVTFSLVWLYFFQYDLLAVAQHSLSGGVTHYDRTIGAVLITLMLQLLQLAVYGLTRLARRAHALTYGPSFLSLAFISDISIAPSGSVRMGSLWWMLVLLLVVWAVAVWIARQIVPPADSAKQGAGLFSARTWTNLVQMGAMMLVVAAVGNTDAVLHFRAHAETALLRGDTREAMRTGWQSLETDRQLTMLRAYALSQEGLLGEKLFSYPVAGHGADLLPMREGPLLLPADSIWRHLGGKPAFPMSDALFYHLLEVDSLATPAMADYLLCGKLVDRDLAAFVRLLPRYYDAETQTLPRHYREALLLYAHQHRGYALPFTDSQLEQQWQQLLLLREQYADGSERRLQLLENYRDTYWYYYEAR